MQSLPQNSMNLEVSDLKGQTEPRIFTPPLRELTPDTSFGFEVIEFAELIGWPLDAWQQWAVIHLGELNPDGTPRFRFALLIVARQNGKTLLCRLLTLYWMFVELHPIIIGTSTKRETAKFSWNETIKMARENPVLNEELDVIHTRETIGEEAFFNRLGSKYMFAAPNRNAGRSYTVNRGILDELRDHKNQDAYDGLINAGNALSDFQVVAITNQGDITSVVLDNQRTSAIEFINSGIGDPTLFLGEWSAPTDCDVTDPKALSMANPNLNNGDRNPLIALMGQAIQAKATGGERLARFKTENLCIKVHLLDAAIQSDLWDLCGTDNPINMADPSHRRSVVLCLDISPMGEHATLVACVKLPNEASGIDFYHIGVVKVWHGFNCTQQVRAELPDLVDKLKPKAFGWFPGGPSAAIAADLKSKPSYNKPWPPRNVKIEELKTDSVPAICMGLADIVHSLQVQQPKDPMLDGHIKQTQKLNRGDTWTYQRAGNTPIDGTYAVAGAVHLARTLPAPLKPVSTGREDPNRSELPF